MTTEQIAAHVTAFVERRRQRRESFAGYCITCHRDVMLSEIQELHPDATKANLERKEYNRCPTCQSWLVPF